MQLLRKKNDKACQKAENTIWRDRANIRTRYGRDVVNGREFKTTVINILRALMDRVDSMKEQMVNVIREMESLR